MSTLQLQSIRKSFGDTAVIHGVDLEVAHGEFVVFVGPSGCGKSTLLRLIAGLESVTSGTVSIDGAAVNDVSAAERGCAMVFQSYALYPHMSVYDNMAFGLQNLKINKDEIDKQVKAAAQLLRLTDLLQRKPTQLSGGQRQRVAIGRAIVRDPKIFLFDEPLSNLDAELRVSMRAELRELHARLGSTMIYVTHDQVEAMTLADKIVVLKDGRIEQVGSPKELYERPANTFVAGFIGSPRMNFIPKETVLQAISGAGFKDTVQRIGVRPEHLQIDTTGAGMQLKVSSIEYMGAQSLVQGNLSDQTRVEVLLQGAHAVSRGDLVGLRFDAAQAHGFDEGGLRVV